MPRTISTALQAEFNKTVTRVGYLVQVNVSPVVRWCNVGTVSWNSNTWSAFDFEVQGFTASADAVAQPTLNVQNLDSSAASTFLNANMSTLSIDVYQVAPSALAVGDVVRLGKFFVSSCEISLDKAQLRLIPEVLMDAFSPRRKIDAGSGFNFALADGTQIYWNGETYLVGLQAAAAAATSTTGRGV